MKKCKNFIALSKEGKIINKRCMNCTRTKQCYHGRTDNYVPASSSKKKTNRKTSKKKYDYSNIKDRIRKIGNNANRFVHYSYLDAFKFDNVTINYSSYDYKIYSVEIKNKEVAVVFPWDYVSIEINDDEKKFLKEKFNIRKIREKEDEEERERKNRILNSINFGD